MARVRRCTLKQPSALVLEFMNTIRRYAVVETVTIASSRCNPESMKSRWRYSCAFERSSFRRRVRHLGEMQRVRNSAFSAARNSDGKDIDRAARRIAGLPAIGHGDGR